MVLSDSVNKDLISLISKYGGKTISLCIIDGGLIKAKKLNNGFDLGYVGEITSVDIHPLRMALDSGYIPVAGSIANRENDANLYNSDTCSSKLAAALNIFDEIQCEIYRSGKLFEFNHFNVKPNIITCVKYNLMDNAKKDAIVLHRLPAHRYGKISTEVFEKY